MNESLQDEHPWVAEQEQRQHEKKLYLINYENQQLRTEQIDLEEKIELYLDKIKKLTGDSLQLESTNERLLQELTNAKNKIKELEGKLEERNNEYCKLYNYNSISQKRVYESSCLSEIQFTNKLNTLQHSSDSQLIQKLKKTIEEKNNQIINLTRRIAQLNSTLLESVGSYQNRFATLKEENIKLSFMIEEKRGVNEKKSSFWELCNSKKMLGLEQQIMMSSMLLTALKKDLSDKEAISNHIQRQNAQLKAQLERIKNSKLLNSEEIEEMITENDRLKKQIKENRYTPIQDNQANEAVENCKSQIAILQRQVQRAENEAKDLQQYNNQMYEKLTLLEKQQEKSRTISTRVFDKLKKMILTYVPYFGIYEFSTFGLDEEEKNFIEGTNVGLDKQVAQIYKRMQARLAEVGQLRGQNSTLKLETRRQKKQISQLEEDRANHIKQIATWKMAVNSLKDKKQGHSSNFDAQDQYQDQQEPNRFFQNCESESESEMRVKILEKGIEELQRDRKELLDMVRQINYEKMELKTEIQLMKKAKQIRYFEFNYNLPKQHTTSLQANFQSNIAKTTSTTEFQGLRRQLRDIMLSHQNEKQLIIKQFQKQEAELLGKYNKLLEEYDLLQKKYKECLFAPTRQDVAVEQDNNSKMADEYIHEATPLLKNNDNSIISESTIQTFTEILKKYERQFNKFAGIYEKHVKMAIEKDSTTNDIQSIQKTVANRFQQRFDGLQKLLHQNLETIKSLEELLQQKDQKHEIEINQYRARVEGSEDIVTQLKARLQHADESINELEKIHLHQSSNQHTSPQSINTILAMVSSKNNEITEMRIKIKELTKKIQEGGQENEGLRVPESYSVLETAQMNALRELIQKQNLIGVLEAVLKHFE